MLWRGSFVALITPFDLKGRVDVKALVNLVQWHIAEGTDGLVCCATTGEGPTLTDRERKRISETCIQTAAGRIPIIVSTGTASTSQTIRITEQAQKWGADGCLVVTPYYNKPSAQGCIIHFQEVAKVGLAVIVYHNPARAVIRLSAETIALISQIPGIVAIKESSHDLELVRKIRKLCSLPIFSGEDDLTFDILREGGVGAIAVTPNLIPRGWKRMIQLSLDGKWMEAEKLARRYLPLNQALFLETNPQCIKTVMGMCRKCGPTLRLPLIEPEKKVQAALLEVLVSLGTPFFKTAASNVVKASFIFLANVLLLLADVL